MEQSTLLEIDGMTCGGCVASVTRVLQAVPGVTEAVVTLSPARAKVRFDASRTDLSALSAAVQAAGFEVR